MSLFALYIILDIQHCSGKNQERSAVLLVSLQTRLIYYEEVKYLQGRMSSINSSTAHLPLAGTPLPVPKSFSWCLPAGQSSDLLPQTLHVPWESTAYCRSHAPNADQALLQQVLDFNRPAAQAHHCLYQKQQNYGFLIPTEYLTHTHGH